MKTFQVDSSFLYIDVFLSENARRAFQQPALPIGVLVRMDIELLQQFGQRFVAFDRGQRHLGLKCGRMRLAASLRHPMVLIRSENARRSQA
jgi:hypothetical protein